MLCAFPGTLLSDKCNNSKPILLGFSWPKYFWTCLLEKLESLSIPLWELQTFPCLKTLVVPTKAQFYILCFCMYKEYIDCRIVHLFMLPQFYYIIICGMNTKNLPCLFALLYPMSQSLWYPLDRLLQIGTWEWSAHGDKGINFFLWWDLDPFYFLCSHLLYWLSCVSSSYSFVEENPSWEADSHSFSHEVLCFFGIQGSATRIFSVFHDHNFNIDICISVNHNKFLLALSLCFGPSSCIKIHDFKKCK
jgi:hypothetical protein